MLLTDALTSVNFQGDPLQQLRAMGMGDEDRGPMTQKRGRRAGATGSSSHFDIPGTESGAGAVDVPGTLGAKLEDLGQSLLHEINMISATRRPDDESQPSAAQRMSVGSGGYRGGTGEKGGRGGSGGLIPRSPAGRGSLVSSLQYSRGTAK